MDDDTITQSTVPAQIVATEPAIENLSEPLLEVDGVAITGPNDAESTVPAQVVTTQPIIEEPTEAALEVDGVAIIGPNDVEDVPVEAMHSATKIRPRNTRPGETTRSSKPNLRSRISAKPCLVRTIDLRFDLPAQEGRTIPCAGS